MKAKVQMPMTRSISQVLYITSLSRSVWPSLARTQGAQSTMYLLP